MREAASGNRSLGLVAQESFGIAPIDESDEGKLHAVSKKRLDRVAALPGSVARYGEAVVLLLSGPGFTVLGCCGESRLRTRIWAGTMPNRAQEENG